MNDYLPDSHQNRLDWLKNFKTQFLIAAATLGWATAKTTPITANLTALIGAYQALVDAENAALQASVNANQVFDTNSTSLRDVVNEMKNNPLCTDAMEVAMGIVNGRSQRNPNDIQPAITAETAPGGVRIKGTKDYAELYNLYMRVVGAVAWKLIGPSRKKFPFMDETPAQTPEVREYQARGVINDVEVGHLSAIVTATFAG